MSWIEFDKTLTKLFESFHQKIAKDEEQNEVDDHSSASSRFVRWLDNHLLECRMEEEFPKMWLICVKCGERITDEQF
jgi:formylmethanofuran dehydrogenase subunit E